MAHPPRFLPLLVLLALLAPAAVAQEGGIRLALSPSSLTVAPATNGTTLVTVTNDGIAPVDVELRASNATGGLEISFSETTLSLLPGRSASSTANVRAGQEGAYNVLVHADARTAIGAAAGNATVRLDVVVRANATAPPSNGTHAVTNETGGTNDTNETAGSEENGSAISEEDATAPPPQADAPPPPAPRVDETDVSVVARPREAADFHVEVRNDAATAQTYSLLLRLPIGWGGRLDSTSVVVPANASATLRGAVRPTDDARDAEAELTVSGEGGEAVVRLHLRVERALPVEEPPPPPPDEGVADDATQAPAPATATPLPTLTLELLSRDLGAPPGTNVVLTAYVENAGEAPAQARLAVLAPALRVEPAELTALVPPGARVAVAFTLAVPEDAALGTVFDGALRLDDGATVSFAVAASASEPMAAVVAAPDGSPSLLGALASVAVGAAIALVVWRRWPGLGLVALYARLAARRALEHPRRARMLDTLRASPGMTLAQLQRATGLSNGVARHHVALLQAAGAIRVVRDGSRRRLWPTEAPRVEGAPELGERVLDALAARGPMRAGELAAELGVSRQALHYHLKKLERAGRVVARRDAAGVVVEPAAS